MCDESGTRKDEHVFAFSNIHRALSNALQQLACFLNPDDEEDDVDFPLGDEEDEDGVGEDLMDDEDGDDDGGFDLFG